MRSQDKTDYIDSMSGGDWTTLILYQAERNGIERKEQNRKKQNRKKQNNNKVQNKTDGGRYHMVIDANMYWMPEELFTKESFLAGFLRCIPTQYQMKAYAEEIGSTGKKQIIIEKPVGYQNLNYVQGEYRIEQQLQDMEEAGVDHAILKTPCAQEWLSLEMCRIFNNGMAEHVKKGKGKFSALAVVPPLSGKEGIYELERCIKDLGMTGVQLSAHYGNLYLDHEAFRPFLKKLNDMKVPAYVHHTPIPVEYQSLYEYNNLRRSYGRCVDQTTAISREVFSGMFDELPDLKLVHSMLGGSFFAYIDSMFRKKTGKDADTVKRFDTDTDRFCRQIRENIYYEMSHAQPWGSVLLDAAVKILGADHIIFGSSYPVRREWLTEGADFVKEMNLPEAEKEMILSGNAKRIYQLADI